MSWINSNATYKQNSKNDLSFYHGFSKTPVEPNTSTGNAATTLANASAKGGHTVIGTEVWAEEIPWFGLVPSRAVAVTRLSGLTKLNDLVKVDGEGGKVYKYKGADDATFTEDTWADFWEEVTLTNGMTLNNRHNQPVLRYYLNQPMQTLTTTNNASIDSKGYATRLFVDESNHTGQTSGGSVVSQFAAGTDNIKNGIPSVELNPKLYLGTTEKIAGTHYYDYNVSGTILWSTAVTSSSPKISCFRYIGKTVTGQISTIDTTVNSHSLDIANIKLALGMDTNPDDQTTSVTARVETVEDVVRTLLGLGSDATITATESIATTAANAVSTSLAGTTDGTIGKAIADAKQEALDAINAIQHFSVVVVPEGQTIEDVIPVENTIYLVSDSQAADGSYIEYIAFKQGEETKVERIGTTKLDLEGYTTDAEHEALQGRVSTTEEQIATITSTDATKEGSIAKALADAKTYAEGQASAAKSGAEETAANALSAARTEITAEIAQAKSEAIASAEVTITAGTGIIVTGEGKGTTFQIAVSDDVATAAALSALSQTVASNKTELEGKITAAQTAASTALETAKTEIKGTTDALDSRLTDAEAGIEALTNGDNSVAKQIETAANAIKGQSLAQTGTLSGMFSVTTDGSVGTGITGITITDTGLANAITKAQTDAETTAATNLATARGEITTEINTAVSGLETKLTTGEDSLGGKVSALEGSVKTINETTIPNAITTAQNGAVTTVKALTLSATDTDDAGKVTVTLGGTVETPTITVTSSDIASAQTLSDLVNTVNTHIAEAAGLYLSVEKVDTLPADADAKTNKIYLVPVDTEAGRENNIHTEYIWTNNKWEIIGTTAIDINSLEASAKAAQDAADKAQGEVDAVEEAIAAMDATETVNGLTVTQVDGKITGLTETLITASVPAGTTSVEGNVAYVGSEKHVIAPEKFQTAAQMPATLTSWVADLPNLTDGSSMFKNCNALTTFIGDLGLLIDGEDMFEDTSLSLESVEYIADTISEFTLGEWNPSHGYMNITWKTLPEASERQAFVAMLSLIVDKNWELYTNNELLPLFDSEKYETGSNIVQPKTRDINAEPETVYYVRKK